MRSEPKKKFDGENIIINLDNIKINHINKQCCDIRLDTDAFIKNLVTLTIYNWQLTDAIDCLVYPAASYMLNSLSHVNNSGKSFAIYCHII